MGKYKVRLNSRKNAKQWKKGQSSLCNPQTTKFRDAALSKNLSQNLCSKISNLTIDKIQKHDAMQGIPVKKIDIDGDEEMDNASTCKTMNTYASNYSKCSNISFNRFLNHFQGSSTTHQEMLATLRTVTDLIKEKGGTESTVEYFAAFLSTLQQTEEQEQENKSEELDAAVITLLGMTLKNVEKSLLRQKCGLINQLLSSKLIKYTEKKNDYIQRHCIGCLCVLLRAVEKAVWSEESTKNTLAMILNFTIHGKPKLRKAAQHAIVSILTESEIMNKSNAPEFHPAIPQIAKFLVEQLDIAQRQELRTCELHLLNLIKEIWHQFPKNYIKTICNQMLANMKLNDDVIVATTCFETLYTLFASRPQENVLPPEMNAQIINALYDYQPSNESTKLLLPWLTTVLEGLCNLTSSSPKLCAANVPKFLSTCMKIWGEANKQEVLDGVATRVKDILTMCVAPFCADKEMLQTGNFKSLLLDIIKIISTGLNFIYSAVWKQVFNLMAILFQTIGSVEDNEVKIALKNTLKRLIDLRESSNISFPGELDYAVGAAVKTIGAEFVLDVAPLTDNDTINLRRYEWLFMVLDNCTSYSTISYFKSHFLNLATDLDTRSEKKKAANEKNKAEAFRQLSIRLWALFPCFCNNATDVAASLEPKFAMRLGAGLDVNKKYLHPMIISGLRKMILKASKNENEEDKNMLAKYAKNFLPRLNNLYLTVPVGTDEQGTRSSVLETIKAYLSLEHPEIEKRTKILNTFAKDQLAKNAKSEFEKEGLYDLIMIYSKYTDEEQIAEFYESFKPLLKNTDKQKEQKKAYRFLEEICNSETQVCQKFLESYKEDLRKTLIDSTNQVLGPSKGPRIRILTALVKDVNIDEVEFLSHVIVEASIGVKEQNAKCRASSFDLFNVLAENLKDNSETFMKFLNIIKALLGGKSIHRSATILVLTSMIYNYNEYISNEEVINILNCVLEYLQEGNREIVKTCFAFVKIFLSVIPNNVIITKLETIVKSICEMTEDCKRHFRLKLRDILTKLMRKFGYEVIVSLLPKTDTIMLKRMKNIRKIESKKKASRNEETEDNAESLCENKRGPKSIDEIIDDTDDESEDDTMSRKQSREKRKRKNACIEENKDNIIDFTDPSTSKKIITSKPVKEKKVEEVIKNRGFKTDADGRLIITDNKYDDDDDDDEPLQKKKRSSVFSNEDDDDYDDNDDIETIKSTKSVSSKKTATTYKAGGSGIHRSVHTGKEYSSKKGKGDVKKGGKVDPYAYVPLRRSSLNKRKKNKNQGEYKSIINKTKKGKVTKKQHV